MVEPFGMEEHYRRTGIIASILANVHRKRGSSPFKVDDFVPERYKYPSTKKQKLQEIKSILSSLATRKVKRNA